MMSVGSPHHAPRTSTAWHSSRLYATRALLSIHNQHHAPWFDTLVVCVVLELTRRHFYSPHARPLLPLLPRHFLRVRSMSVRVRTCPCVSVRVRFLVRMMPGYCPVTARLLSGYCSVYCPQRDVQMDRTCSNHPPLTLVLFAQRRTVAA